VLVVVDLRQVLQLARRQLAQLAHEAVVARIVGQPAHEVLLDGGIFRADGPDDDLGAVEQAMRMNQLLRIVVHFLRSSSSRRP
jgi:hypothetical protein